MYSQVQGSSFPNMYWTWRMCNEKCYYSAFDSESLRVTFKGSNVWWLVLCSSPGITVLQVLRLQQNSQTCFSSNRSLAGSLRGRPITCASANLLVTVQTLWVDLHLSIAVVFSIFFLHSEKCCSTKDTRAHWDSCFSSFGLWIFSHNRQGEAFQGSKPDLDCHKCARNLLRMLKLYLVNCIGLIPVRVSRKLLSLFYNL